MSDPRSETLAKIRNAVLEKRVLSQEEAMTRFRRTLEMIAEIDKQIEQERARTNFILQTQHEKITTLQKTKSYLLSFNNQVVPKE